MNKISLSLKITSAFATVSVLTVVSLFVIFSNLFEEYMLRTENEKVILIAETIEPMVAMNNYLGLHDEVISLVNQIASRKNVLGGVLIINESTLWEKKYDETKGHFHINYPVKDPVTQNVIGQLIVSYSKDSFNKAVSEMRHQVLNYLAMLSGIFLAFAFVISYLLKPLSLIANKVKDYQLGDRIEFDQIRMEPETEAISDAFDLMVDNIREYTVLLEQYKISVDESSIVSKMDEYGNITYVNDEFIRVCGYDREDVLGSKCGGFRDTSVEHDMYEEAWEALREKQIWKGVVKNISKAGIAYYVKTTIVPLLDENGELLEFISIQHDITEVVEQREIIQRQITDETTGLPNRIKLQEDAQGLDNLFFAMVSMDNYDVVKNYYGYDSALQTLRVLADRLVELLKPQGVTVYKLASGEFALLSSLHMELDWFKQVCRFVIEKIESTQMQVGDNGIDFNLTIGCTSSCDNYLSQAGLALRYAVEHRMPIVYFEDQDNLISQYENNITWTRKLKEALAEDRITLFAQPIVNGNSLQGGKYECLLRLIDEDGKYVSPYFFLDVAKKTKLYHYITSKVIDISFDVFSKLPESEFSINLSAEDILHKETVSYLESMISKYDIGNRLILEIVESEGIDSFQEVVDFIVKMKGYGCKIAIDDFGTGYSNFSYLMKLEVDYIKIDGSLIKDIDHNKHSQVICFTILNFCKTLNMTTVAEFVHNDEVLNKVQDMGFDYLQGFYLGEPRPIHDLLELDK